MSGFEDASADAPRVVVAAHAEVGEGPVIDPRTGDLVWVDITRGALHRSDLAHGTTTTVVLPTMLGAAVPRAEWDGFAVAVREGFGFVQDGVLTVVDPVLEGEPLRMNDAKCDARGRLWAGSTEFDLAPGQGRLHRWDGEGPSTVAVEGMTLPNGIGWNADSTRMYVVDSMAGRVSVCDFDLDRGVMGDLRVFAEVGDGLPDGLAVDEDGGVWVAVWDGFRVCRFDASGRLTRTIRMPVARPSSCAFGSDGTMFVTSAHSVEPHSGSVFAVDVGVAGVPVASFRG